jgi:hypothetical protein
MHMRLLLMQHFLAVAADFMLRCGLRRGSGRSKLQSRRIPGRPFAASCSSSHNADKVSIGSNPANGGFRYLALSANSWESAQDIDLFAVDI